MPEKVSWIPLRDKKKTAYLGVYLALALICSYVESLIPFYFGIPGVKLGLTNIVVVLMLYCVGTKEALAVSALRIVLSGFLFGNMFSILYSLAGGLLSFLMMYLLKKNKMVWCSACQCEWRNLSQCRSACCGCLCCGEL